MVISLPRRLAELEIDRFGSGFLVHDRQHDYVHVIDEHAATVLAQCDGTHTCAEIAQSLCVVAHETYDQAVREVAHLVANFADLALLEHTAST